MKRIEPKSMKPETKRQPVGQFIDCYTGQITNAYAIEDDRFFVESELRKDGQPSGRSNGRPCQIKLHRPSYGKPWFIGRYAPVLPEREAVTEPMRRRILEIRQQADHLERQMLEIYAGETLTAPVLEQNTHCCYCGQDLGRVLDPDSDTAPAVDDDIAWSQEEKLHLQACEWVRTRAHRIEPKD